MVLGRAYQPPQRQPTDLACHHLETIWQEKTTRETSQAAERRPEQILDRHDMAEDSTRQGNLETACWGLRPTTGHNGCLMMMMVTIGKFTVSVSNTIIHSHWLCHINVAKYASNTLTALHTTYRAATQTDNTNIKVPKGCSLPNVVRHDMHEVMCALESCSECCCEIRGHSVLPFISHVTSTSSRQPQ